MRQLRFVARAFQTREKKNKFFQKTRFFGSFIRDTFFRWKFFSRFWLLPFRAPIEPFFMYSTHRIFYDPGRPTAADHNCQSRSNFFPGNLFNLNSGVTLFCVTPAKVFLNQTKKKKMWKMSTSGCDSVGIAVASDTRGPRFKSIHRENLWILIIVLKKRKYWKRGRERPPN